MIIYGVDTEKPVTPKDVRDAVEKCFTEAHQETLKDLKENKYNLRDKLDSKDIEMAENLNVNRLLRNLYKDVGGDYENPTKQSIVEVCLKLSGFAEKFKDPQVIKEHYGEVMMLVNKLEDPKQ